MPTVTVMMPRFSARIRGIITQPSFLILCDSNSFEMQSTIRSFNNNLSEKCNSVQKLDRFEVNLVLPRSKPRMARVGVANMAQNTHRTELALMSEKIALWYTF